MLSADGVTYDELRNQYANCHLYSSFKHRLLYDLTFLYKSEPNSPELLEMPGTENHFANFLLHDCDKTRLITKWQVENKSIRSIRIRELIEELKIIELIIRAVEDSRCVLRKLSQSIKNFISKFPSIEGSPGPDMSRCLDGMSSIFNTFVFFASSREDFLFLVFTLVSLSASEGVEVAPGACNCFTREGFAFSEGLRAPFAGLEAASDGVEVAEDRSLASDAFPGRLSPKNSNASSFVLNFLYFAPLKPATCF